jgi:hypothetical protein
MDNEGRKLNENPKTWRAFFMNPGTGGGDLGGSEADIADGLRDSGWLWLGETLAISAQAWAMPEIEHTISKPCLLK